MKEKTYPKEIVNFIQEQFNEYSNSSVSTHIKYSHTAEYNIIIEATSFLNSNCKLTERLYCVTNNIQSKIMCTECNTKPVKFVNYKKGYREYCSTKCSTNNYNVKERAVQTCLEKYGTERPLQNKDILERSKQTCMKNYGTYFPLQNNDCKIRYTNTCLEKYGVSNPSLDNNIHNKKYKHV